MELEFVEVDCLGRTPARRLEIHMAGRTYHRGFYERGVDFKERKGAGSF